MKDTKKKPWPPERVFVVHPPKHNPKSWNPSAFLGYSDERRANLNCRGGEWVVTEYRLAKPTNETDFNALADAIDQHLGWRNDREREAGDYVGRIKQVGAILKALGTPEHLRSSAQQLAVAIVTAGQRVMMLGQAEPRENGLRVAGKVGRAVKAKRAKARKRKAVR